MSASNCIFCKIAAGEDANTKILYQSLCDLLLDGATMSVARAMDENFVVFPDIRPAAKHHYLVVPKIHIPNINSLTEDHNDLVNSLVTIGNKVLLELDGDQNDIRLGFHRPPFTSISHLHLHVISPASTMGFIGRCIFRPDSWWFTTVKTLQIALKKGKL